MENIRECQELERTLYSEYWSGNGSSSVSRRIMEEPEESFALANEEPEDEQDEDLDVTVEEDGDIEMREFVVFSSDQEGSEQAEVDLEAVEDAAYEPLAVRRSHRLQEQQHSNDLNQDADEHSWSSQQRSHTPPLPENEREEPWHFAHIEHVWKWREFSRAEIFQNISQPNSSDANSTSSRRGPYKSTTTELDQMLLSKCTRRLVEWRRKAADGLSNEALDQLLDILHDPECNVDALPRNHYYLEQLQDRALTSFTPKTTTWRIPKVKNDLESEEITFTDIADLLQLQLQDPEVAQSIITEYSENNGVISHPSHGEIWRKLASYDAARECRPLFLKV